MLKLLALVALLGVAAAADYPTIKDFGTTGSSLSSVTLSWTLDVSGGAPEKYTLTVDGILTIEFFYTSDNTYTVTGLQSCTEYSFELTADYANDESGPTAQTYGSTEYEQPDAVTGLTVDGSGSVISWTAPTNERCVEFYKVCWLSTVTGDENCETVFETTYDLGTISGCDDLTVTVTAVAGPNEGEPTTTQLTTGYATPGEPINLVLTPRTDTSVWLSWDPPLENPACVQDYSITWGPCNITESGGFEKGDPSKTDDTSEDEDGDDGTKGSINAEIDNLPACTDLCFGVATVSTTEERSDDVTAYYSTNGSAPGLLPDLAFNADEDSITITWGDVSEEACLDVIQICYSDLANQNFTCVDVPGTPNQWTLEGLGACQEFEFAIFGLGEDGSMGPTTVVTVPTQDVAPGAVQNMELGEVGVSSFTVYFDEPLDYPECADEYIVTYTNILETTTRRSPVTMASDNTDVISGLDACAIYSIGVSAVSASGLEGPVTTLGATLAQDRPDPPSGGSVVGTTTTSLTVLWYAPEDTRFCVDSYGVRVSQDGLEPTTTTFPAIDFNKEMVGTISGLIPCTSYAIEIKSWNSETNLSSDFVEIIASATTDC